MESLGLGGRLPLALDLRRHRPDLTHASGDLVPLLTLPCLLLWLMTRLPWSNF